MPQASQYPDLSEAKISSVLNTTFHELTTPHPRELATHTNLSQVNFITQTKVEDVNMIL